VKPSLPEDAYNELAASYAAMIDTKPHNAYYDRPVVQSLVGDIRGARVLEAGCGTGVYTEWLIGKGASIVGIDANENMMRFAQERNKSGAEFVLANLEEPLVFLKDGEFDGIVSALTITYLRDLRSVFSEFGRVLKPGGWFVLSTEHPFFSYRYHKIEDYYATKEVSCVWRGFEKRVTMKSYHHSLSAITEALSGNGFVMERIVEPKPLDEFKDKDPENYEEIMKFPLFIFLRARRA
jgi:ubiquinone/menaquinone biosynthesis C-methylase UbiE